MNFEVLVATMNQEDYSLIEKMNIQSDAIICNQNSNRSSYEQFEYNGNTIRWYNFQEKGVGLNRNNALMRSTADICLLADDDVVFVENYQNIVLQEFEHNDADVIVFNIFENDGRYVIQKKEKVDRFGCGRYGAVRIAFRRLSVIKNRISFSLLFGGGARFTAGEDTMFLEDCFKNHLTIIAVNSYILKLNEDSRSTWFTGYNNKFFHDMGASFHVHYGVLAIPLLLVQLFRHRKQYLENTNFMDAFFEGKKGIKEYKEL